MASRGMRHNVQAQKRHLPGQTLNVDVIKYVKSVFKKADLDGGGDLDENEFAQAFAGKLNTDEGSDAESMRKLFYRIDANSDGAVGAVLLSSGSGRCHCPFDLLRHM